MENTSGLNFSIYTNFLASHPTNYLTFGPLWWTLKEILRQNGEPVGDKDDPQTRQIVEQELELITLQDKLEACEAERNYNLGGVRTNKFDLPDGASYLLYDDEALA